MAESFNFFRSSIFVNFKFEIDPTTLSINWLFYSGINNARIWSKYANNYCGSSSNYGCSNYRSIFSSKCYNNFITYRLNFIICMDDMKLYEKHLFISL